MEENLDELHQQLKDLKIAKEFKDTINDSRNLIKRDTNNIPSVDDLDDKNKGLWVEHGEGNFAKMFEGLLDYCADEEEYDNLDWNTVNYELYGADYYEEKFPGFSEEVYEILAKSTEEENKIVDKRTPPLQIKHEEVILSFK
jgi:hypothetical protein|tara:strand:- start:16 stop:441 length:426 start_codon:yes stop_codon:yes gene_type:complete